MLCRCSISSGMKRKEALALGLARYTPDRPCRRGHVSERFRSGNCVECHRLRRAKMQRSPIDRYLGQPCGRGHVGWRYSVSGQCIECNAAKVVEWRERNPEGKRLLNRNRLARQKGAYGTHSQSDIDWLLTQQRGKCALCLRSLGKVVFHVDHRIPIVAGGRNDRSNIQITHKRCNLTKNATDPIIHAQRKFQRLL